MSWRIALVQMECVAGAEASLARIESRAEEAAKRGAQLDLFPECATTSSSRRIGSRAWLNLFPVCRANAWRGLRAAQAPM